jgi:haloacetate dehalogenase
MSTMKSYSVNANGIRQHIVEAGEGPPVILLHGFPETGYAWRFQIPVLAERYRVIVPDLRGYGETEKPATGYDKRNMALDIRELMRELDIPKIALVGHDRGARVATRFSKDFPDLLDRLVVMDNVPTRVVSRELDAKIAQAYWFFLFHLVPDLPEALIAGREHIWLRHFFSDWCHDPLAITGEAFDTYVKAYQAPGAVRGASPRTRKTKTRRFPYRRCHCGARTSLPSASSSTCPKSGQRWPTTWKPTRSNNAVTCPRKSVRKK